MASVFEVVVLGEAKNGDATVPVVKYEKKIAAASAVHAAFLAGADAQDSKIGPVTEVQVRPFRGE